MKLRDGNSHAKHAKNLPNFPKLAKAFQNLQSWKYSILPNLTNLHLHMYLIFFKILAKLLYKGQEFEIDWKDPIKQIIIIDNTKHNTKIFGMFDKILNKKLVRKRDHGALTRWHLWGHILRLKCWLLCMMFCNRMLNWF